MPHLTRRGEEQRGTPKKSGRRRAPDNGGNEEALHPRPFPPKPLILSNFFTVRANNLRISAENGSLTLKITNHLEAS